MILIAMLTDRQIQLLEAIINEYIKTAEPIGSVELVSKYNLKCSAATVRNEMARLIDDGFLEMVHTSSGRVPTRLAYRLYLDQIMQEEELPVLQEVAMKQRLWANRFEFEKLLREAVLALAEATKGLAIATTSDGYIVHAGAVNVLENKEFWDIDVAKAALTLLDRYDLLEKILASAQYGNDVKVVLEEEIGLDKLDNCAVVFSQYNVGKKQGYIAVLGPSRNNYAAIIPAVRYTKQLIEELGNSW
jgi:transcriptional regulator of heat shock response